MRHRIALLMLTITLLSVVPAAFISATTAQTGANVAYTVKVTAPPNERVAVTATFTDLTAPVRLAIGLDTFPDGLDLITDLGFTTPDGRPLTYKQVDSRTVEVAGNPPAVVAHYMQNLRKAQYRGNKVEDVGGKLTGYESLLVPASQPLAAAKVRFDLPNDWTLVSAYPQEGEWSVIQPYAFGDLSLEVGVSGWYFGTVDFDQTRTYPDGFKIRVVMFKGRAFRSWDVYQGNTVLDEAMQVADFYHQIAQKYRQLFGEFPFDDLLLIGPEFWQGGLTWHAQSLKGMREAEFATHHVLHAYVSGWPGRLAPWGANWVLLREGFTSYAEGMHTAEITGDPVWRGMLYDRSFLYVRARMYGNFTQNSRQYILGPIVAFMVDDRIRQETDGQKRIDDLMALLWRKYKTTRTAKITDAMLLETLNELTGQDWQSFYESSIANTDSLDISVMDRVKPDFPAYLARVAQQYYNGHASAYFINAELVAATGDLDMGIRMQSPFLTYDRTHLTMGNFAVAARRYKDLAKADLTEAEIVAILGQMTGQDHSDLFRFYRGLGFTVDPAEISEYVRTFSVNWDSSDNHVRLTDRTIPIGGSTEVEAELVDPAFAAASELLLQVNAYDPPGGLADMQEMVSGAGVCFDFKRDWPDGNFGPLTQYIFRVPKFEQDGKSYTRFNLHLPKDAGVLELYLTAKYSDGRSLQDQLTPNFKRGIPMVPLTNGTAPAGPCSVSHRGGATPGQNFGGVRLTSEVTLGQPTPLKAELAPEFAQSEALVLQLNVYKLPTGASLQGLVSGDGVTYRWDQKNVQGSRGLMSQVFFNLPRRTENGKTYTSFTLNLPADAGDIEYLLNAGPQNQVSLHQEELWLTFRPAASAPPASAVPAAIFRDVPANAPFGAEIGELAGRGIIAPDGSGNFRPVENLTRADLAQWLVLATGAPTNAPDPGFADVGPDHPAHKYIAAARAAHIINGYADGTFQPDAPVTRAQMAAIITRAFHLPDPPASTPSFVDVPPEAPFWGEIRRLAGAGITRGFPDGTFHPSEYITRAQAAAFVARTLRIATK